MHYVRTIDYIINGTTESVGRCKFLTEMEQFEIFISLHREEVNRLFRSPYCLCLSACPSIATFKPYVTFWRNLV